MFVRSGGKEGIAIPTGTTILHFIYPDLFPIIDVWIAEVLNLFGYLKYKSRTENNYYEFFKIMHQIKSNTNMSFRKIDRALFSCHKIKMNYKTSNKKKLCILKNQT